MYALVVFLVIGGDPTIQPVGPFKTMEACQEQLKYASTITWPDTVEAVGLACLEVKEIKHG